MIAAFLAIRNWFRRNRNPAPQYEDSFYLCELYDIILRKGWLIASDLTYKGYGVRLYNAYREVLGTGDSFYEALMGAYEQTI